jgi:DNA repair exonuclease SbcCD ATPase subunit
MQGRTHTTAQQKPRSRQVSMRYMYAAGALVFCIVVAMAIAQQPSGVRNSQPQRGQLQSVAPGQPTRPGGREPNESAGREARLTAGRRKVLTMLLEQLQQQTRETEAALRDHPSETDQQGQTLRAELQALTEQMQLVQRQMRDLPGVQRARAMTGDLKEAQPNESLNNQTAEERPETTGELTEAQQERLRAQYRAALEAREREGLESRQPEGGPPVPTPFEQLQQRVRAIEQEVRDMRKQQTQIGEDREQLHRSVADLRELVHAVQRQMGQTREELSQIRANLTQMQQKLEVLEPMRLEAQSALRAQIEDLRNEVRDLQKGLVQTQALVNSMLCQTGRSTVGSAGYAWGW